MVASALDLIGGVVREGIEVVSGTRGSGEDGGGGAAQRRGRHFNQVEEVDFGER